MLSSSVLSPQCCEKARKCTNDQVSLSLNRRKFRATLVGPSSVLRTIPTPVRELVVVSSPAECSERLCQGECQGYCCDVVMVAVPASLAGWGCVVMFSAPYRLELCACSCGASSLTWLQLAVVDTAVNGYISALSV